MPNAAHYSPAKAPVDLREGGYSGRDDKTPPIAEANLPEHALIACCLEDSAIIDNLKVGLFGDERCKALFEWLTGRRRARIQPPELAVTMAELWRHDRGLYLVGLEWLKLVHSPANWSYWEQMVRESAYLRHSKAVAAKIQAGATDGDLDLMEAVQELRRIEVARAQKMSASMDEVIDTAIADMEERYQRQEAYAGADTGFPSLNQRTDGLTAKALWVIAARPAVGKTTLACNLIVTTAVRSKLPTVFFSLEMPSSLIAQKLFHAMSGISQEARKRHNLSDADFSRLGAAAAEVKGSPLHIVDSMPTIQAISAEVKRLKACWGVRVVVIDYLQRVRVDGSKADRWEDIGRVSNALKNLAMETDTTVVALAQLSRSIDKEEREPSLADLRGSAEIEADADVVAFLWRHKDSVKLTVGKSRMGSTGNVPLSVNYDVGRFEEAKETPCT